MDRHYAVAIDGPAGAGKTNTAKRLAEILLFRYIDTGMFYRALAFACLLGKFKTCNGRRLISEDGLSADQNAVTAYFRTHAVDVGLDWAPDDSQVITIDDEPFQGPELRQGRVSQASSVLSTNPVIRNLLLGALRTAAAQENCVMEGRDIGTVVLPDADCKIFLTASPEIRAKRRVLQDAAVTDKKDNSPERLQAVLDDILLRDERDRTRAIAPLKPAENAVLVDNGAMTLDETVGHLLGIIKDRGIPVPKT